MKTCPSCLNDNLDGAVDCSTCGYKFDGSITGSDKTEIAKTKITSISTGDLIANRYFIDEELGRGGMGVVYLTRDTRLRDRQVALKMIHPNLVAHPEAMQRFLDEVSVCMDLLHPCIVRVHNLEEWAGHCFFTMEYLEGRSLREWIIERNKKQKPPFNLKETVSIIDPLLQALTYAHKHTIHRDIKPENIMVRGDFPDVSIKVLDFGIAKTLSTSRFTQTSQSLGTAYYMSPEQMTDAGEIDHRADLYSVGMILYEMLTGKMAIGIPVLPSKQFPNLPAAVDEVIVRLLSVSSGDRYPDAGKTRKALLYVLKTFQKNQEVKKKEEQAKKQKEDEIAGMTEKGRVLIEQRRWIEAIEVLTRAKKLAPGNKQVNGQLTIARDNLKRNEKEEEIANILEKGRMLIEQHKWSDGEKALLKVLNMDPENTDAKKQLFNAVQKKKEIERQTNKAKEAEEQKKQRRFAEENKQIEKQLDLETNKRKKIEKEEFRRSRELPRRKLDQESRYIKRRTGLLTLVTLLSLAFIYVLYSGSLERFVEYTKTSLNSDYIRNTEVRREGKSTVKDSSAKSSTHIPFIKKLKKTEKVKIDFNYAVGKEKYINVSKIKDRRSKFKYGGEYLEVFKSQGSPLYLLNPELNYSISYIGFQINNRSLISEIVLSFNFDYHGNDYSQVEKSQRSIFPSVFSIDSAYACGPGYGVQFRNGQNKSKLKFVEESNNITWYRLETPIALHNFEPYGSYDDDDLNSLLKRGLRMEILYKANDREGHLEMRVINLILTDPAGYYYRPIMGKNYNHYYRAYLH